MKKLLLLPLFLLFFALSSSAQAPCVASFATTPITIGNNLLGVHLTNLSTYGTLGSFQNISMMVNYGTGPWTPIYSTSANNFYTSPGTYTIKLAIRKYDSLTSTTICTDTMTQTFTATWPPCGATISAVNGPNGVVTFTATNPAGSSGIQYYWSFGDGYTGSGSPVSHTYANGTYNCSMISSLPSGCSDTNSITVVVSSTGINCSTLTSNLGIVTNNGTTTLGASSTYVPGYTLVYDWDFGNGTSSVGTASVVTTIYAPGTYNVALRTLWKNSANVTICSDTVMQTITVLPCATAPPSFTTTITSPGTVAFTNTSAVPAPFSATYWWTFSPSGGFSLATNPTYTYTSVGTYNVMLVRYLIDSASNTRCTDTGYSTVVITSVPPPPNYISGVVLYDSIAYPASNALIVYLIQFDTATNMLTAVDSQMVTAAYGWAPYSFNNKPAGNYLTKASLQNNVTSSNGLIPTYHDSGLYWSTATSIVHGGGSTANNWIHMRHGTTTAGPGFVGGNVSLGANKGTTGGVPKLSVYLRNSSNQLVKTAITDANGDYSFSSLPVGNYTVYPENMNYATTAYPVSITAAQPNVSAANFNQDNAQMNIKPRTTGVNTIPVANGGFSVYPNPAKNTIKILYENMIDKIADIIITDITGQIVMKKQIAVVNGGAQLIDVSQLNSGLYFIRMQSEHIGYTQKIAIRH